MLVMYQAKVKYKFHIRILNGPSFILTYSKIWTSNNDNKHPYRCKQTVSIYQLDHTHYLVMSTLYMILMFSINLHIIISYGTNLTRVWPILVLSLNVPLYKIIYI